MYAEGDGVDNALRRTAGVVTSSKPVSFENVTSCVQSVTVTLDASPRSTV